jgi:O-antigen/teichoic acid export membrane protein
VVAEGIGVGDTAELPALVGTALIMLLALGVFGALVLGIATPWVVQRALQVPAILEQDTRAAFYLLAISLPAVLVTAGLGGVLAAYQRFKALNLIRIPMSILSFVLPMAVLPFTHGLAAIVSTLVAIRFVGTFAHLMVCVAVMPDLRGRFRWVSTRATSLLKSGGWIAVINLIVPLFVSLDRMLIGALTSVAAIAFYAPPQEIATKLWILPGTLVSVLFPAFAASTRANPARSEDAVQPRAEPDLLRPVSPDVDPDRARRGLPWSLARSRVQAERSDGDATARRGRVLHRTLVHSLGAHPGRLANPARWACCSC